jgi:hypothetical protein
MESLSSLEPVATLVVTRKAREKEVSRLKMSIVEQAAPSASTAKTV